MKYLRNGFYLGFILLMLLAACGPGTPTPGGNGPVINKPNPFPNVIVSVVPPVLTTVCTPPIPKVGQVSSYCANQTKGLGGITYSDLTYLGADNTSSSWLVGDSIPGGVSCTLDNSTSTATCSGAPNGTFQGMVCSSCGDTNGTNASFVCAKGYNKTGDGYCYAADANKNSPTLWCPAGSHYDNALQNCADNVTNKLASLCPSGYPAYTPYNHKCWNKVEMAFNCQTFSLQLGSCPAPKKVPNVVPFCQNNDANIGGANITFPAGSILSIDIKSNHLDSCTPGATQPDGSQLFTCLGTAGRSFDANLCTDPASCATYKETLGTCAGKNNTGSGPAPCVINPRTGSCQ